MNQFAALDKKAKAALSVIIILLIASISFLVYRFFYPSNPFGDAVTIKNLSELTRGKPSDRRTVQYIENDLLKTINQNLKQPIAGKDVTDLTIRQNSFSQKYDDKNGVHTVRFIVDSAKLQQSYKVSYQWAQNHNNQTNVDEWGTVVSCPDQADVIYKNFKCHDMFSETHGENDPILQFLPKETLSYKITYDGQSNTLKARIETNGADERGDPAAAVEGYKKEINDWIKSVGLDPAKYKIEYSIIRASIY